MRLLAVLALLLLTTASLGPAAAAGGLTCVKTQCESTGRACVETLYAAHETCMKTGNLKCRTVPPAEQYKCLTGELRPCVVTRIQKEAACLEAFRSCYRACGPLGGKRADYWCVASLGRKTTAGFCATRPGSGRSREVCTEVFTGDPTSPVSLTCEPL
ncbi:MAG: hypothetical protein AB7E70_03825 [Hyphomicrobiaceae bacterium]